MRTAFIRGRAREVDVIRRYLPSNYIAFTWATGVWIEGNDVAGWTLDGYVIPRLASGGFTASEMRD